jgi:hypothetical protein
MRGMKDMLQSKKIKGHAVPIKKITDAEKAKMYQIFTKYYDNVDLETFLRDFNKKDHVCLMRRKTDNAIVGFSTVTKIKVSHNGSKNTAIFSGDTVIEKQYWGSTALHLTFLKYVLTQRIYHPFSNIYWFLISKGYKTYLLMANNFYDYYPRYDREHDPRISELTKLFCHSLFPGVYNENTGLLLFGEEYQKLKENVAEIDDEMKRKHPKIAYFEKLNPTWRDGTELPCLVEIAWVSYLKTYGNFILRKVLKKKSSTAAAKRLPQVKREEPVSINTLSASIAISSDASSPEA